MRFCRLRYIALVLLTLFFASCYDYDDGQDYVTVGGDSIYVTITIDTPLRPATRALPQGGESGDGLTLGVTAFKENEIYDLTVFKVNGETVEGKYITVTESGTESTEDGKDVYEYTLKYARGSHPGGTDFLVVANYGSTLESVTTLTDLKNQTIAQTRLWTGDNPSACDRFLMSSASASSLSGGSGTETDPYMVHVDLQRLAARIDFCSNYGTDEDKTAAYGEYSVKDASDNDITVKGFKYPMGSDGYFILESITPFNLNNESEYLFRRVQDTWSGTPTTTFLGAETTTNYVVDPKTAAKTDGWLTYTNSLNAVTEPTWSDYTGYLTAETLSTGARKLEINTHLTSDDKSNDFVGAYAMENTLRPESPLKKYATGLVITGSYYKTDKFLERKTFYCFLRHQTESTAASYSYQAYEWAGLTEDITSASTTSMNIAIVRNNIYRLFIESINEKDGKLKLKIAIHDWMKVKHPLIYS